MPYPKPKCVARESGHEVSDAVVGMGQVEFLLKDSTSPRPYCRYGPEPIYRPEVARHFTGSIEVVKDAGLADLGDLFANPVERIGETRVDLTIVDGAVVFMRQPGAQSAKQP